MMMMDDEGLELDPFDSSTIVPDDREPLIRGKHDTLRQKFNLLGQYYLVLCYCCKWPNIKQIIW